MRLLLDTNVVVVGLLWNGAPRRLLYRAMEDLSVELYSSPVLIDELTHTLGYAKFAQRIVRYQSSISALVTHYQALVILVSLYRTTVENAHDSLFHKPIFKGQSSQPLRSKRKSAG